jgi:hypothetical protein
MDHTLSDCTSAKFHNWEMGGFTFNGDTLKAAKRYIKYPRDAGICFFCWWPGTELWDHKSINFKAPDCNLADAAQQIVWWYFTNDERRQRLGKYFGIEGKVNETQVFFRWLSEVHSWESEGARRCALTNAQRVIIWVLYIDLKMCDFNKCS